MYDILSVIFFICALIAAGDFNKLAALLIVSALFAIAGSICSISIEKIITNDPPKADNEKTQK